ncbi:probable pectinesterase 53 [Cornus florida]|uniref:probable pectinesterase 53 n=1 Tax=Cornus florida TaxID=4283 RepID=UPI0028966399|nr:probable pectinesterase 53 [Cornus florida]
MALNSAFRDFSTWLKIHSNACCICFPVFLLLDQSVFQHYIQGLEYYIVIVIEDTYHKWIRKIGSFNHSLFQTAKNKFNPCLTIKVNKNPSLGDFVTVQEAINSLPIINNCRVVISVSAGIYSEKIEVPVTMAYISVEGAGADTTIIEWDDTADRTGQNGQPLGTLNSATFAINSPYFMAKNITFKNKAPSPPSGALGKQAVALRISADTAAFIGCKFIGAQDTLFDHKGRHYFRDCYIQGSVDFIFGNGRSLYENCHLHAITNSYGALTAQKRESLLEETGFSFIHCKVTGSGALYLGRAWGTFSRVVFAYTYMDRIITPRGWYDWGDKKRERTVFYGQFKCSGPGADFRGRVSWSRELTPQEAEPFISLDFIYGNEWLTEL